MTTTRQHPDPDTVSGVLAGLRGAQESVDAAKSEKLRLAASWAAMHAEEGLVGPLLVWEQALPLAGEGAPLVAEFCVPELAAALGLSPDAGRAFLADAVELRYRLPRLWARVLAGGLRAWKARRVAQATLGLSLPAAGFVDAHVAGVAHKIGPVQLDHLIQEAQIRFDPEEAERARVKAAEHRHFDVYADQVSFEGTGEVAGTLDLADALDLEQAVQHGAADLAALGNPESLTVRRCIAVGQLARRQLTLALDLNPDPDPGPVPGSGPGPVKARQVMLHVHLADSAIARIEQTRGMVSVEQVKGWCTNPDTTVVIRPVLDLTSNPHTDAYKIPDRMRVQVQLRDHTCVFPWCTRPARRTDTDHLRPWPHGPTEPANLASLCRRHHRAQDPRRLDLHLTRTRRVSLAIAPR